ncbi:MAG: polyprenyl diphosphate synthase [Patescibacteria group bacterium]|nr:polyprenyl diphosphate synthase [Patescibacteria group bacterium]MDD5715385.1 polyprenyl diphosphate synthase [Patescibacteria group bacterium]
MHQKKPHHVAIIMDGNRRWARERGKDPIEGHWAGYSAFKRITEHCFHSGIPVLTVWAFSTENWKRPEREVAALISILRFALDKEIQKYIDRGIRFHVIGRIGEFPEDIQRLIKKTVETSAQNTGGLCTIALNYGGRMELVDALRQIASEGIKPEDIDEHMVSERLYTRQLPDPDLVIRTSGEVRTSGFMPWQSAYAEYYFTPTLWPDFTEQDFDRAVDEYLKRKRNFGA